MHRIATPLPVSTRLYTGQMGPIGVAGRGNAFRDFWPQPVTSHHLVTTANRQAINGFPHSHGGKGCWRVADAPRNPCFSSAIMPEQQRGGVAGLTGHDGRGMRTENNHFHGIPKIEFRLFSKYLIDF